MSFSAACSRTWPSRSGLRRDDPVAEASQALLEKLEDTDTQSRVLAAAAGLVAGLVDVLATFSNLGEPEVDCTRCRGAQWPAAVLDWLDMDGFRIDRPR